MSHCFCDMKWLECDEQITTTGGEAANFRWAIRGVWNPDVAIWHHHKIPEKMYIAIILKNFIFSPFQNFFGCHLCGCERFHWCDVTYSYIMNYFEPHLKPHRTTIPMSIYTGLECSKAPSICGLFPSRKYSSRGKCHSKWEVTLSHECKLSHWWHCHLL